VQEIEALVLLGESLWLTPETLPSMAWAWWIQGSNFERQLGAARATPPEKEK